jgi:maltooligosyltrehalose trehalohydrolase
MSSTSAGSNRPPLGATIVNDGVEFRVWAPEARSIDVEIEGLQNTRLDRDDGGVWAGRVRGIGAGTRYRYRIDDRWGYPDPYSQSQPDGPHGPSEVVDPAAHAWRDGAWRGLTAKGLVIYELHTGTFTPEGTFDAIIGQLDQLARLGVTALELMPIAEFPGARNWGYDGVDLFAPSHVYGGPAALKRLVDAAHARGLGVIIDVVYNHLGPDGNYLPQYARDYLTQRHETRWGDAMNYDGPNNGMVRRFVIDNACYWLNEYHFDGLRIDAAFTIFDDSERHILEELATTARASVPSHREVVLIAETYENDTKYVRVPTDGGFGFDAVWADDFHHVVHAMASREHSGYYQDYAGTLDELARTINRGWLFEGQESKYLGILRGTSAGDLPAEHFIYCIDNHDQAANRAFGRRLSYLVGAEQHRAGSAVMLLLPYTPMIFMGQEFAASTGFYYFTDHGPELGEAIRAGRHAEFAVHEQPEEQERRFPDPQDPRMFEESKLKLEERDTGAGAGTLALYSELLRLRKEDAVLSRQDRHDMHAYAASETLLIVHLWHGREHRLILGNVGIALDGTPAHAHVTAALSALQWTAVLSTDDTRFGGGGGAVRFDAELISMPANTVAWLAATEPALTTDN